MGGSYTVALDLIKSDRISTLNYQLSRFNVLKTDKLSKIKLQYLLELKTRYIKYVEQRLNVNTISN